MCLSCAQSRQLPDEDFSQSRGFCGVLEAAGGRPQTQRRAHPGLLPDGQSLASGGLAAAWEGSVEFSAVGGNDARAALARASWPKWGGASVSRALQELSGAGRWAFSDVDAVCGKQPTAGEDGETGGGLAVVEFGRRRRKWRGAGGAGGLAGAEAAPLGRLGE